MRIYTIIALQQVAERPRRLVWIYLLLITIAELVLSFGFPQLGLTIHALLLICLIARGALGGRGEERLLTLALTLAPLMRLLSLSLPLTRFPQLAWYPIVSVPLLAALWLVVRLVHLPPTELGLRLGNLPLQLMLAGGGLGLGAVEYGILRPAPLIPALTWSALWFPALILIVFTGLTEELFFRGLLQSVASPVLGRWAYVYVSLLFAVLHIGYLSLPDFVFVFAVGLLFAYVVRWGGSLLGVTLAHGITNVMLFLIMPALEQQQPAALVAVRAQWVIWAGTAAAVVATGMLAARAIDRGQAGPPDARPTIADRASHMWPVPVRAARSQSPETDSNLFAYQHHEQDSRNIALEPPRQLEASERLGERAATPIEQVIEQIGERHIADLRLLSERLQQLYAGRLSAKNEHIAELSLRVEIVEHERDDLEARMHGLHWASERHIADLQVLSENLSRHAGESDAFETQEREGEP
jgi:membrane protease YdiL (CAAX protease family)